MCLRHIKDTNVRLASRAYSTEWIIVIAGLTLSSLVIGCLILLNISYAGVDNITYSFLLLGLLGLILLICFIFGSLGITGKLDIFSPWVGFPVFYCIVFGLGSVRWILESNEYVNQAIIYAILGLGAYFVGTLFYFQFPSIHRPWRYERVILITIIMLGIATLAGVFFYSRAGIPLMQDDLLEGRLIAYQSGTNALLYLVRLVSPAFLILFTFWAFTDNKSYAIYPRIWKVLIPLLVFAGLVMLSTASRTDLFFLVFMSLLIYRNSGRTINRLKFITILLVLFLGIFFYGYVRLIVSDPGRNEFLTSEALKLGMDGSYFELFLAYIYIQLSVYMGNFLLILELVPKYLPFMSGQVFLMTLATVMPNTQDTYGDLLKIQAGLAYRGGGVNPTILGELYADFGLLYIVAMMFIYGLVTRSFYTMLNTNRSRGAILLYSFVYYALIISTTGGLFSQLSRWYYFGIFLLSSRFVSARAKS